jgi:6-phosphofructokinase 2
MALIATLTLNPSIDAASEAEHVGHTHKVRTTNERFDAGGGGINVARVLTRLGSDVEALYLAGGTTGPVLSGLLDRAGLRHRPILISGDTRISQAVLERSSGKEYRFVPQGPEVSEAEYAECLDAVRGMSCAWLVLSGSLPRGLPADFYVRLMDIAASQGMKTIIDTSGPALKAVLDHGGAFLVKPSLGEMEQVVGRPLRSKDALEDAARQIVDTGGAQILVVSMGHEGALLVQAGGKSLALPAIPVEARSAVGAGDSLVAAITHGLSTGRTVEDSFRLGIAAGAATVLTPGTDLCHPQEIARLAAQIGLHGFEVEAAFP